MATAARNGQAGFLSNPDIPKIRSHRESLGFLAARRLWEAVRMLLDPTGYIVADLN